MSLHRSQSTRFGTSGPTIGRSLTLVFLLGAPATLALADPVPMPSAVSTAPWAPYKVKQGVAIERRPVPGSRFFEYRAGFTSPIAAQVIAEQLWRGTS